MMRFTNSVAATLRHGVIGGLLLASVGLSQNCDASEPGVFKVEEDWEMVIHEPDAINVSPQVTFAISPTGAHEEADENSAHNCYFHLQMNYAADQNFSAGGFHVAAIEQDQITDEERSECQVVLSSAHDQLRWTSVMAVVNGKLMYAVKNGYSGDWGSFGGPDYLVQMGNCPVNDLQHYSHQWSLENVDVSYGGNRVASIKLARVRLYYPSGQVVTIPLNAHP